MVFDTSVAGPATRPLVLMLHGFCVSRHFWDNQIPAVAAAGCFAVASNQRGYAAARGPILPSSTTTGSTSWLAPHSISSRPWGMEIARFISSAMIGAAAYPGSLPTAGPSGSRR